jgi:carbohydrate-selective porin OprB
MNGNQLHNTQQFLDTTADLSYMTPGETKRENNCFSTPFDTQKNMIIPTQTITSVSTGIAKEKEVNKLNCL